MNIKKFINPQCSDYIQVIISFMIGLFFGPLSSGILYFIITLIIWECLIIWSTKRLQPNYRLETRIVLNVAGIIGWILSRWLYLGNIGYSKFIILMSKL